MLRVTEHSSPNYPARTYENARVADLTVAFALDFNTAGERLTKRAAGERYTYVSLNCTSKVAGEKLARYLREFQVRTLNIAGNGIYSLAEHGWTQKRLDLFVFETLRVATKEWPLKEIVSGGQTGADLAGVTAAVALGIDAEARLPKGFIQRSLDNQDRTHTREEIIQQIEAGAAQIAKALEEVRKVLREFTRIIPDVEHRREIGRSLDQRSPTTASRREPRLFNIKRDKDIPSEAVYIGRGTWRGQRSELGNPFAIGVDGGRYEVCDKFQEWASTQPDVMAKIESLRGKDLVCYCAPYRCHGDWILRMANRELSPSSIEQTSISAQSAVEFDPQI